MRTDAQGPMSTRQRSRVSLLRSINMPEAAAAAGGGVRGDVANGHENVAIALACSQEEVEAMKMIFKEVHRCHCS